jgi:YD repeat-containing protein
VTQLVPVDGKTLDWPRRVANALNRLISRQADWVTFEDLELAMSEKDTSGSAVPTWKGRTYTYDGSGNPQTETVTDGTDTWVKTYTYTGGTLAADSGWVKQ